MKRVSEWNGLVILDTYNRSYFVSLENGKARILNGKSTQVPPKIRILTPWCMIEFQDFQSEIKTYLSHKFLYYWC